MRKLATGALLGLVLCFVPSAASAQEKDDATRAAARGLGTSGVENYLEGRYEQASDELEKAYGILHAPSLALWSARALVKRGLLVEGAARYLEATGLQVPTGDASVQKKAIEEAGIELAALKPRIPSLLVQLSGAEAAEVQVSIDGKAVAASLLTSPRSLNPGAHEIVGLRGGERVALKETLGEGQRREVTLRFSANSGAAAAAATPTSTAPPTSQASTSPTKPSAQRTFAIVSLAAGGAGLVLGGIAGALAISKKSELDDSGRCTDGCPSSLSSEVDELHLYRPLSTAGFIAGGVLTGLGVVLWVTAPSPNATETRAALTPNGVVLSGRF